MCKNTQSASESGSTGASTMILCRWLLLSLCPVSNSIWSFLIILLRAQQDDDVGHKLDRSLPSARISRKTAILACQYSFAFYIIYVPSAVISLLVVFMKKPVPFAPRAVHGFLAPLQGFLNALVYSADIRSQLRYLAQSIRVARSIRDIGMQRQESSDEEKEDSFAFLTDLVHEAAN